MSGYFSSAARALATSFQNLFRKPVTVEFPKVIRPRAERYRASFALLHEEDGDEACIGCLQCERICPSEVISIKAGGKRESPITGKKRGYADDFVLDLNACIYCELCVQVCPTDAIVMTREPELPAYGREDLVLTMAKLYANEKSKQRAWGDATRLNGMQVPPKPPAAPKPESATAPASSPGAAPARTTAPAPTAASPAAPPTGAIPATAEKTSAASQLATAGAGAPSTGGSAGVPGETPATGNTAPAPAPSGATSAAGVNAAPASPAPATPAPSGAPSASSTATDAPASPAAPPTGTGEEGA